MTNLTKAQQRDAGLLTLTPAQQSVVKRLGIGHPWRGSPVAVRLSGQQGKSIAALESRGIVTFDGWEAKLTTPLGVAEMLTRRRLRLGAS